ncbi:FeoA family protein [Cohaesibacter celericrescens]|uniref:Ferrous iron transport protein A n=1 Tax=Cohaesibacter celericrescens TaxID=2067669 RepID=A0A2N5XQ47_9HYPH|nr:FeoA family protein [Cohaesibacter celericrescens]PLW76614.1 ferrous iron transport protein A [Cohaesibacter celericrescens]
MPIKLTENSHNYLTLNDILPGRIATIRGHRATGAVRQRLLDLGLMPNVAVLMVRAAPLNDPIELRLEATDITLRRREAATIEVFEDQNV